MKLELIKKTNADSSVCYFINKDGSYVTGSTCVGKDALTDVMQIFEVLKKGIVPKEEVIMVEEV